MKVYLVGQAGSGKDTAAEALCREHPTMHIERITFPIYQLAKDLYGMTAKDRRLLQLVGDALRSVDPDCLANRVARVCEFGDWTCPDVRLPREADILRETGWIGVRVERPALERREALNQRGEVWGAAASTHHTETECDSVAVDAVVVNDCSIEEFRQRVLDAVDAINERLWVRSGSHGWGRL